jgi:hypothetical protein
MLPSRQRGSPWRFSLPCWRETYHAQESAPTNPLPMWEASPEGDLSQFWLARRDCRVGLRPPRKSREQGAGSREMEEESNDTLPFFRLAPRVLLNCVSPKVGSWERGAGSWRKKAPAHCRSFVWRLASRLIASRQKSGVGSGEQGAGGRKHRRTAVLSYGVSRLA